MSQRWQDLANIVVMCLELVCKQIDEYSEAGEQSTNNYAVSSTTSLAPLSAAPEVARLEQQRPPGGGGAGAAQLQGEPGLSSRMAGGVATAQKLDRIRGLFCVCVCSVFVYT